MFKLSPFQIPSQVHFNDNRRVDRDIDTDRLEHDHQSVDQRKTPQPFQASRRNEAVNGKALEQRHHHIYPGKKYIQAK